MPTFQSSHNHRAGLSGGYRQQQQECFGATGWISRSTAAGDLQGPNPRLYTHTETNASLFTCSIQDGTVQEKTSQTLRHGRPISAVPWILCLTSVSSRNTAGREATTPTESTRWCPAHTHTDAGEVKHVLEHSQTDLMWHYVTCGWWLTSKETRI